MFGVWLAGVLVVIAAGASRAESRDMPDGLVGQSEKDVLRVLGKPLSRQEMTGGALNGRRWLTCALWFYEHEDWLGGVESRWVAFDQHYRVVSDKSCYLPFAERPAWLVRFTEAFSHGKK